MKYHQKGEFGAAMKGYIALGKGKAEQDQYRLDITEAALFHGFRHANFDPRVVEFALGSIRPDVKLAMEAAKAAWVANGKDGKGKNFSDEEAAKLATEFVQPVIRALRELRREQEANKEEKKQAKDAAAREQAIARMEAEQNPPSPFMLKNGEAGGTVELTEDEYNTLVGLLADIRKGDIATTVDVRKRVAA